MKCKQCGADLPEDTKFCVQCGAAVVSNETTQPTLVRSAALKSQTERLRKRSLPSIYFEAARLFCTNLNRYLPATIGPSLLLYFLEPHSPENGTVTGAIFIPVFLYLVIIVLLSGILGHITGHIYVGHHTRASETLKSAARLVPAEFIAGLSPVVPAALLLTFWLRYPTQIGGGLILFPIWAGILWAISILAAIVVESENIKNPFKAIVRAFKLLNARNKIYRDGLFIIFVVILNMTIVWLLGSKLGLRLIVKLIVEPIFEIVYGLMYFNLRFMEGGFDIHVLSRELGFESHGAAVAATVPSQ
jgi:zinc-ribbon domain